MDKMALNDLESSLRSTKKLISISLKKIVKSGFHCLTNHKYDKLTELLSKTFGQKVCYINMTDNNGLCFYDSRCNCISKFNDLSINLKIDFLRLFAEVSCDDLTDDNDDNIDSSSLESIKDEVFGNFSTIFVSNESIRKEISNFLGFTLKAIHYNIDEGYLLRDSNNDLLMNLNKIPKAVQLRFIDCFKNHAEVCKFAWVGSSEEDEIESSNSNEYYDDFDTAYNKMCQSALDFIKSNNVFRMINFNEITISFYQNELVISDRKSDMVYSFRVTKIYI